MQALSLEGFSLFGERKRTAVQHLPNQSNTKKRHKTQWPQKKGKQAHQSDQAPHAHAHKNQAHTQTSPQASPRGPTKKDHHNSPILTLDKISKASKEDKPFILLLTFVVWFPSLSSSLFLFSPLSSFFSPAFSSRREQRLEETMEGRPPFRPASGSLVLCRPAAEFSPTGPIRFPQHLFSVHDHGRLRSSRQGFTIDLALRRPDCTLSRLFASVAEEYERPVTQPIATPEPGCPGPHPRSSRNLLEPWVCLHTREPTVLSRVSCRPAPEYWQFSPALPVTLAHPLLPPKHGWLGQG